MTGATVYRRFYVLATRDLSLNSGGQVPVPQARIAFHRQGATVRTPTTTIAQGSSGTVEVYGLGGLVPGDSVRAGVGGGRYSYGILH